VEALESRFPSGRLERERELVRVEALLALHRNAAALARLDALDLATMPRAAELQVLRGELRLGAGRALDATRDFDAALDRVQGDLRERALLGRSRALAARGDAGAAP
jgi:hypothetical protein